MHSEHAADGYNMANNNYLSVNDNKSPKEERESTKIATAPPLVVDTTFKHPKMMSSSPSRSSPSNCSISSDLEEGRRYVIDGESEESTTTGHDGAGKQTLPSPLNFIKTIIPGVPFSNQIKKGVRLGRRRKKKNTSQANERTPLNRSVDVDEEDDDPLLDPRELERQMQAQQRAKSRWAKLHSHVSTGEMLLRSSVAEGGTFDRDQRRREAQKEIQSNMEFSLKHCLLAICGYMAISVIAFSFILDHWSIIDSIYFSVVTFTTIGYGDLVPATHAARLFTCFFALSGVACLGIAIGVLGNNIIEAQEKAVEQAKELSTRRVMTLFTTNDEATSPESLPSSTADATQQQQDDDDDEQQQSENSRSPNIWSSPVFRELGMVLIVLTIFGFAVSLDTSINLVDTPYFLLITSSTVGFGDIAPTSQQGRLVTALFIPLAVGAMGRWLSIVAGWIVERRQSQVRRTLARRELSTEDLELMDEDGDGNVTRAEFLEFMLVAMNKVDRDLMVELKQHFAGLDTDGTGVLSKADMIAMARKKLKDPKRKLELSRYKAELMEKASGRRQRGGSFWGGQQGFDIFQLFGSESHDDDET